MMPQFSNHRFSIGIKVNGSHAQILKISNHLLRTKSSKNKNPNICEKFSSMLPPSKINGTSPLTSSPWLSTSSNGSSRYLYRGKFQPNVTSGSGNNTSSNSINNNNGNGSKTKSPWQLRSNLSSFARRRRGSSTSLHTFSDNDDETLANADLNNAVNGFKKKQQQKSQPDSISLAGSEESVNRRQVKS